MKHTLSVAVLVLGLVLGTVARAEVETFTIDPEHSFANWEVRHVVALTSGTFHGIKGRVLLDTSDLAKSSVEAEINIYSLNSSHLMRDLHLLTSEYLDARSYPEMKFVSTAIQPVTPERGTLTGLLTLRGITRPVTLDYQILGIGKDPWGGIRAGFRATTRIKRSDFGVGNHTENGPVGNEVDITLLIEGIKLGPDGLPLNSKKSAGEAQGEPPEAKGKDTVTAYPMPTEPEMQAQPLGPQPGPAQAENLPPSQGQAAPAPQPDAPLPAR